MRFCRLLWVVLVVGAIPGAWASQGMSRPPNIVLFLVDDMGWMDSEPYGSQYYRTPAMSRLAAQSMRFTSAYASPVCSPTRASILTGQYPSRHGIFRADGHLPPLPPGAPTLEKAHPSEPLAMPVSKRFLEHSQITLAQVLQSAGYRTAHIGKWHLGLTEPYWPEHYGFDVAIHGAPDPGPYSYFSPYGFRDYQSFPDGPAGEYITDRLTDEAIRFVTANKDRPFFLNLWHYGVHGPWGHKEAYTRAFMERKDPTGRQGNPIMASMLQSIDESLQRLLDTLDQLGIADNTIVVFYSDNGGNTHSESSKDPRFVRELHEASEEPGSYIDKQIRDWQKWAGDQPPTNNAPLRAGKGTLYEGGIRVPLMIRWPGHITGGVVSDALVSGIDLYPTILGLIGHAVPKGQVIDGVDITPLLLDGIPPKRNAIFSFYPVRKEGTGVAVRSGSWKLIRHFVVTANQPAYELYNLDDDIGESHNLAMAMPAKVRAMDRLIDGFLESTGAPLPQPNPAYVSRGKVALP